MTPVEQLVRIPFPQGLPADTLWELAEAASELTVPRGNYLIHQHDQAHHVFFLEAGVMQIFIRFRGVDDLLVGTLREPGALIGWSVFRKPYRYTTSVRCAEPSRVVRLPREVLTDLIHREPRLGYLLLRRVAAWPKLANLPRKQPCDNGGGPFKLGSLL
jgi:CRP-like cAMP-binding protein